MSTETQITEKQEYEPLDYAKAEELDENLPDEAAVQIAFKKLVNRIGTERMEDVGPVEAAYRAIDDYERMRGEVRAAVKMAEEANQMAQTAISLADQQAKDEDDISQKQKAKLVTRNLLVKNAALGRGKNIRVPEVQDKAQPKFDLAYQTVKDAWKELETETDGFSRGENAAGKKVLKVDVTGLRPETTRAVEHSLGRNDLTKRLISRRKGEGA